MDFYSKKKKYFALEVFPEYVLGEDEEGLVELIPYYDIDRDEDVDTEESSNIVSLGWYKWLKRKNQEK
jgi:hypothetical protein